MSRLPVHAGRECARRVVGWVLLDKEDADALRGHTWFFKTTRGRARCAVVRSGRDGKKNITMHGIILPPPPGMTVDHINGNPLDNRRKNLRHATASQQQANRGVQSNNTSGLKGAYWHKGAQRWMATICAGGKQKYLGLFRTAMAAHRAYCRAGRALHGEFFNAGRWRSA